MSERIADSIADGQTTRRSSRIDAQALQQALSFFSVEWHREK